MEWITENIPLLIGGWLALIGFLQIVVRITPTEKDNKILAKVAGLSQGLRNWLTAHEAKGSKDIQ